MEREGNDRLGLNPLATVEPSSFSSLQTLSVGGVGLALADLDAAETLSSSEFSYLLTAVSVGDSTPAICSRKSIFSSSGIFETLTVVFVFCVVV